MDPVLVCTKELCSLHKETGYKSASMSGATAFSREKSQYSNKCELACMCWCRGGRGALFHFEKPHRSIEHHTHIIICNWKEHWNGKVLCNGNRKLSPVSTPLPKVSIQGKSFLLLPIHLLSTSSLVEYYLCQQDTTNNHRPLLLEKGFCILHICCVVKSIHSPPMFKFFELASQVGTRGSVHGDLYLCQI